MKTCGDCIHYYVCYEGLDRSVCSLFKDKSKFIELPCSIGNTIYRIYDDCEFPGECGTKMKCKGCEYRNLFIEEQAFCISMLRQNGTLCHPYYLTREEAEKKLED